MKLNIQWISIILLLIVSCSNNNVLPSFEVFTDFSNFNAITRSLVKINFEDLPSNGNSCADTTMGDETLIDNPIIFENVIFTDPYCIQSSFCSAPTCEPDSINPDSGNVVLALNQGSTIHLPEKITGAMFVIQGMGNVPYSIEFTDYSDNIFTAEGDGVLNDVTYLGVTNSNGIKNIEILTIGPNDDCPEPPCGPLVLSAVYLQH